VGFGPIVGRLALYSAAQHFVLWAAWYVRATPKVMRRLRLA